MWARENKPAGNRPKGCCTKRAAGFGRPALANTFCPKKQKPGTVARPSVGLLNAAFCDCWEGRQFPADPELSTGWTLMVPIIPTA